MIKIKCDECKGDEFNVFMKFDEGEHYEELKCVTCGEIRYV